MTAAELLEALREAADDPTGRGEGFTAVELAESAGIAVSTVRRILRPLVAEGRVRPARKIVTTMSGTRAPVASYVLVEEAPKPKARARRRRR